MTPRGIELAIMKLLETRHPRTICPSEVARRIDAEDFLPHMPAVREAAARLAKRGRVDVLQKGKKVALAEARGPIRLRLAATVDAYRGVDFRRHPERYRVGRGEQGVLTAEPYKSELLPLWRFKTEADAKASSKALRAAFVRYRKQGDFVGMDMARKFLQMGFTRARRYANRRSGRKYVGPDVGLARRERVTRPLEPDAEKALAAKLFHEVWQRAERDRSYSAWRRRQREPSDAPSPSLSRAVTRTPARTGGRGRR
jgi:hypothetical protein